MNLNNYYHYNDLLENIKFKIKNKYVYDEINIKEPPVIDKSRYLSSLKNPIRADRLCKQLSGNEKITVLISDITRNIPSKTIFEYLMKELNKAKVKKKNITVIVALGVHRKNTTEEIKNIIGDKWIEALNIKNHDAFDKDNLVYLGKTKYKTPVWINKDVYLSDYCIALGKIEPHEFAGFSGGRKSILPGVCGEETIIRNHKPEWIVDKNSQPGNLKNNKIHKDMMEAAEIAGLDFIINVVVNKENKIVGIFAGDPKYAHLEGCKFLETFSKVNINKKPDIIITTPGEPLNINLYQSVKSIFSLEPILKPNSNIILYTACYNGIGSDDMLKPFIQSDNIDSIYKNLLQNYTIEKDHSLLLTNILKKNIKLHLYSLNIKNNVIENFNMFPVTSIQNRIDILLKNIEYKNDEILIFPYPQRTIPVLK